jgi:hypothetical protein
MFNAHIASAGPNITVKAIMASRNVFILGSFFIEYKN